MNKTSKAPSPVCNVLIVDDHPAIALLLGDFVRGQAGFAVSRIVHDPRSALEACAQEMPDLAVLDIGLPERSAGLELLGELRRLYPDLKILVFSALSTVQVVQQALQLGANGFLEKSAPFPELLIALERVRTGQTYLGSSPSEMVRAAVLRNYGVSAISAQDVEVLRLLSRGLVVKEIATELSLSASMIYKIIERLRGRFSAKTNEDLIVHAIDQGLLSADVSDGIAPRAGGIKI